jgi:hypothetical protein
VWTRERAAHSSSKLSKDCTVLTMKIVTQDGQSAQRLQRSGSMAPLDIRHFQGFEMATERPVIERVLLG